MHVACRLVVAGQANAFVSAGNTGACMAISKMVMGKIPGVDRPALSAVFPTAPGGLVVLVDVGANVDCSADMLAQFAVMGEIYSRLVLKIARPRVGLLSIIGEEEHKGNELTRAVTPDAEDTAHLSSSAMLKAATYIPASPTSSYATASSAM